MDYSKLLDLAMKLGYRLAMSGAETFRVEESVNRVMRSYGVAAEAFAIPNLLIINIETPDGQTLTRMRRIGHHGNDLDSVERYSNISRRICRECPSAEEGINWIHAADAEKRQHSLPVYLIGGFLGASGFTMFYGGALADFICSGICGILVAFVSHFLSSTKVNTFFSTITSAFILSLSAYLMSAINLASRTDTIIIGALMILVPGLLFTNAMRDIIFGDTNSGINRIVQVLLIAMAIALGTGAAWSLTSVMLEPPADIVTALPTAWVQCLGAFIGCIGFVIIFNIHGFGGLLCALGGFIAWGVYCISYYFSGNAVFSNFIAAAVASIYSEVMARVRKYPAISYLVVSLFPLLPGAGIYYTANFIIRGDMSNFSSKGIETVAVAVSLAAGILIVSTAVRFWTEWKYANKEKKRT